MNKQKSYRDVFCYIIHNGKTTRREIEKGTGYSWGTVSSNVCSLIDDKYVKEIGLPIINGVGRSTCFLAPNHQYVSIGVDITFSHLKCSAISLDGESIHSFSRDLVAETEEDVIKAITDACDEIIAWVDDKYTLFSIGVSCQGGMNKTNGTLDHFLRIENWKTFPIREYLKDRYHLFTMTSNDMNCIANDYYRRKEPINGSTLIIRISDGIGFAFTSLDANSEKIVRADFGHTIVKEGGEECACGKRGCLEEYSSVRGVMRRAKVLDREELFLNQKKYKKYIEEAAFYLGIAIVNILAGFEVRDVILSGRLAELPGFVDLVNKSYNQHKGHLLDNELSIRLVPELSASIGAALKAAEERILYED